MESIMATGGGRGAVRRAAVGLAVAAVVGGAVAGCDSPIELDRFTYVLTSVNGAALPAPYPDPFLYPEGRDPQDGALRVSEGTLSLHADGTLAMTLVMRCASPPPAGTECEIEGDGRHAYAGHYSETEDFVEIEGREYPFEFDGDRVEITIRLPQSMGFWPVFGLEFRR